jgi:hypothetical protein
VWDSFHGYFGDYTQRTLTKNIDLAVIPRGLTLVNGPFKDNVRKPYAMDGRRRTRIDADK